MASNARNLANLLGTGQSTISAEKLGSDIPPGTEDYSSVDSLGVGTTIGETAFVEGSNRLYIWNGSGWYNIALINTTPTWDSGGQPAVSYELDADSPQSSTTVTLAASDPEGLPISYNYITSGQMDSIATISQDSSVFTITPKTSSQAPAGGTGSITFRATDGINILPQVSSFTLNFVSTVDDSKYTTFLLDVTSTGNTTRSAVLADSSSNNWSFQGYNQGGLQSNVNTGYEIGLTASSLTPFRPSGYSAHFGTGGSERITIEGTKSTLAGANADFSIGAWIYPTAGNDKWIYGTNMSNNNQAGWHDLYLEGSTKLVWRHSDGSTHRSMMSTNPVSLNEWSYVLINRTSSVTYMYINGSLVAQNSDMTYALYTHTNAPSIGIRHFYDNGTTGLDFEGYITDVHVKTAAISSPTTVPTERPVSDNDTWLLAAHLPYLGDGSSNNYTITGYSGVTVEPFTPYDKLEYSVPDHGISHAQMKLYQNGDYENVNRLISTSDASSFDLDDNNFTIKFWMYPEGLPSGAAGNWNICGNKHWTNLEGFGIVIRSQSDTGNNPKLAIENPVSGSTYQRQIFNTIIKSKQWYYVEITNTNGTISCKLNGVQESTTYTKGTNNSPSLRFIYGGNTNGSNDGSWESHPFRGYLCDFQWVNGVTAAESSVPTAPLSTHSNALVHFSSNNNNVNIRDNSMSTGIAAASSVGGGLGPQGSTAVSDPFGGSNKVLHFTGDDYLKLGAGSDMAPEQYSFGTGDFTIETWIRWTDFQTGSRNVVDWRPRGGAGNYPNIYTNGSTIYYHVSGNRITSTDAVSINTWYHLAICRSGTSTKMFINGSQTGSTYSDTTDYVCGIRRPMIGTGGYNTDYTGAGQKAYMYDFRITKGLARYTANFTPPTASLEG